MALLNQAPQLGHFPASSMGDWSPPGSGRCALPNASTLNARPLTVFNPSPIALGKAADWLLLWSQWNIIFSYTTYFEDALRDEHFMQLAVDVVQSGLAVVSHSSEGILIWKSPDLGMQAEPFDIQREAFVRMKSAQVSFPEHLDAYQRQCALHAAQLRFYEHRFVSPILAKELKYFRAFLDPCDVRAAGTNLRLYPSVTVHRNGVFQMDFRVLSYGSRISTQTLIETFVNAPFTPAQEILLPPALMRLDARKLLFEDEFMGSRAASLREWQRIEAMIDRFSFRETGGEEFEHDRISIDPEQTGRGPAVSLTTVVTMLGNALETLLNQPRRGWQYRLRGPAARRYRQGQFWSGEPTVYLLSMKDHPVKASDIYENHADDLSQIMVRSSGIPARFARKHLGESLRLAEDYLSFTGKAINLFVFSDTGLKSWRGWDPNLSEAVYGLQAQVDVAHYLSGSLWQCEERALRHARTVEELIANRERQTFYDYASRYAFHSGELNDWLAGVQKVRDLDATRAAIAFNTTLNLERFKERRNFRRQQFQWLMAALLGVIAAGTSGGALVKVAWEGAGGTPLPDWLSAVAAMAVVVAVFALGYRTFVEPVSTEEAART